MLFADKSRQIFELLSQKCAQRSLQTSAISLNAITSFIELKKSVFEKYFACSVTKKITNLPLV